MSKMRVLVTGLTRNVGGVESVVWAYVSRMQDDIQFDIYCSDIRCAYEDEFRALGCQVVHGTRFGDDYLKGRKDLHTFLTLEGGVYDALWHNASMLVRIDELTLARKSGIPRIIIHAHNSGAMFDGVSGKAKSVLHAVNRRRIGRVATDYWSCSSQAAQYFFTQEVRALDTCHFIPNAIDIDRFRFKPKERSRWRGILGIGERTSVVGFVGRLSYQKDPEMLVRVFASLHSVRRDSVLIIAGDGELSGAVHALVRDLHLEESVKFLGSVSDPSSLYSAFDAFLLPSRFEGLGIVLVEAQAAGLPCIVSDTVPDEVELTGLLKRVSRSASCERWARQLCDALNAPLERERSAQAIANGGFSLDVAAQRMRGLFLRKPV